MTGSEVWGRERILALCPDSAARVAAHEQAVTGRWASIGATDRAVWGRCQGSARTPYETVVELGGPPAYRCSCPSRRSPCKHALGLLLLWSVGGVPPAAMEAEFAKGKLPGRIDPGAGPEAKGPAESVVADPEAAARRAAARVERVSAGLDDLDLWLTDQIRGGLAGLKRVGFGHFERVAARMIDAQAPGVAAMLRAIPAELSGESWPERVLERLAALHLLIQAHRRLDRLAPELAANVRSRVGYPVTKAQVLASPGVPDCWVALGLVDTVEAHLETRRVWLFGTTTKRWAMCLSFAVPGASLDATVLPGQLVYGALHFYPGSSCRVLIADPTGVTTSLASIGSEIKAEAFAQVQQRSALLLATDPWATRLPAVVSAAPLPSNQPGRPWRLRDAQGHCVELVGLNAEPWTLLARSGGEAVRLFGEWSADGFRPLSALPDQWGSSFSVGLAA